MNVELNLWRKLTGMVILLLFVAGLCLVGAWYYPLIERNERMRKLNLQLDEQIRKEEALTRQLRSSIETLSRDPKAVERVARETLGYAKPGETVIRFEEPVTNAAAGR